MNVQRIAITGIGVDDNGDINTLTDLPRAFSHLGLCEQAHIWFANRRRSDAVPRDESHGKPDALSDLGRKRIKHAGKGD